MTKKKDPQTHNELKNAKHYFSKKLEEDYKIDRSFNDAKFRDLDDESLKISKIKARIDVLRKQNIDLDNNVIKKKVTKECNDTIKIDLKEGIKVSKSKNNLDKLGQFILNYQFQEDNQESLYIFCLKNFEINSKLIFSGNIIKIPKFLLIELLKNQSVRLLNKYEIQKFKKGKNLKVGNTIRLSEVKRSQLNNTKKLSE